MVGSARRVLLATSARLPDLTPDEDFLRAAFRDAGVACEPYVWDSGAPIDPADTVLIRTCWDYHLRRDEFLAWADTVATHALLLNPPELLHWNSDKHYLVELEGKGVRIVPTVLLEQGSATSAADIMRAQGWERAITKPAISASAHRTAIVDSRTADTALRALLTDGAALVQPFVEGVRDEGEWSLIFIGGEFSHAVIKRPAVGDFRVQEEWGGSTIAAQPDAALLAHARAAMNALPIAPVYARVDSIIHDGKPCLMEFELIEPSLFFLQDERAAVRLAAATIRERTRVEVGA